MFVISLKEEFQEAIAMFLYFQHVVSWITTELLQIDTSQFFFLLKHHQRLE